VRRLAVLTISLLVALSSMPGFAAASASSSAPSLAVISPFPELPAVGQTFYVYAALRTSGGYAPLPQTYLVVSTSNSSVLRVALGAVRGGGYLAIPVVPVSPGTAVLTVSAPALGLSANATIMVGRAVGYPYGLSLEPLPPDLLYGENGSILVESVDAFGNPAPLGSGASVSIYSYPKLVSHQAAVTIPRGSYMAYASLSAGNSSGTADLFGVAQGLSPSGPAGVTVGRFEPRLAVTLMPDSVWYPGADLAIALVQILDPSGRPLVADFPVRVFLSSSNGDVVEPLSSYITIPAGSDHAWAELEVTGTGNASLTAQAQGFLSGSAAFSSIPGSAAPTSIELYGPSAVALGQTYPLVLAAAANGSAVSVVYPAVVTSDNPGVASPLPVNTSTYSSGAASTANLTAEGIGSATLTASSQGLAPGYLRVSAYEPGTYMGGIPAQLALYGPGRLISGTGAEFCVQLLTSYGYPAPAPSPTGVLVQFYPAPGYVGELPPPMEVEIPAGSSAAQFNVTVAGSGELTMVASAEGVSPASLEVESLSGPSPVQPYLVASVVPPEPMAGAQPILYLYLEDAAGDIISPWTPVNVSVIGPDGFSATATIPAGGFYASMRLPSMPASASWYLVAYSGQLGTSARFNYSYVPVNLTIDALSALGTPVQGIGVGIRGSWGTAINVTTDQGGMAIAQLPPGVYEVEFPESAAPAQGIVARFQYTPNGSSNVVWVNLTSPAAVIARYQLYYQVTVLTAHGVASGSGLFPQGSIDIVSVSPTRILGIPGYAFAGWTGTRSESSPSFSMVVESPQLLIAEWRADWTLLYVLIAIVLVGAIAAALVLGRRSAAPPEGATV